MILGVSFLGTGCVAKFSESPIASNFPTANQYKLQAASHWNIVSTDIADRLIADLSVKIDKTQGLYVSSVASTPFNKATEIQLISSLLGAGYRVQKSPENAIKVEIDTQVVQFSSNRNKATRNIGVPTALVSGVWFLSEIGTTAAGVATAGVALGDLTRNFNSDEAGGPVPQTEILVNTIVSNNTDFVSVSKGTYYVADTDKSLYEAARVEVTKVIPTKAFSVKGEDK